MKSMLEADGRLVHFMFFADHYQPSPPHHICHHPLFVITIIIINTRLSHSIIFADQLKAKNQGDKVRGGGDLNLLDFLTHFCSHHCRHHLCHRLHDQDYFWRLTVPAAILLLLTVLACLFFTRHDSLCCQVTLYWIYMKSNQCLHFLSLYSWVGPTSFIQK